MKVENPYRQYSAGDRINFTLHTVSPNGLVTCERKEAEIQRVRDGGFFGRVLIPKDKPFIIKTSVPDPWHDLWRRVNWGFREFPSQMSETQARLDHMSMNLIAGVLPILTNGKYYAPRSLGYTYFNNGFAQVIEKLDGRGPRYDLEKDEYSEFRQAQRELTDLILNLGLEQAGQIHPRNPFAMANIWKNQGTDRWEWLDTLPAIRHTVFVWPLFYFPFHRELRNYFCPETGDITFNKIHTDLFLNEIQRQKHLFTEDIYQRLLDNINLYEQLWQQKRAEGESSQDIPGTFRAAFESGKQFLPKVLSKVVRGIVSPIRIIVDPHYRNRLVLNGVEQAFEHNLISQEELQETEEIIFNRRLPASQLRRKFLSLVTLPVSYAGTSVTLKSSEALIYLSILGQEGWEALQREGLNYLLNPDLAEKAPQLGLLFVGFRLFPSIIRPLETIIIAKALNVDLKAAIRISAIPALGQHLAVPAQIGVSFGSKSEALWHYTVRNMIAKFSSISPTGGWGTQLEGQLWKLVGGKLEGLADNKMS